MSGNIARAKNKISMRLELTFFGRVVNGEIRLPQRFKKEVGRLFDNQPIEVTFRKKKKRRSTQQNRYYWGVVIALIREFLNDQGESLTAEQVHEILKNKFLKETLIDETTGEITGEYSKSTTELSKLEFADYVVLCQKWANDFFDLDIPEPNEQTEMQFS